MKRLFPVLLLAVFLIAPAVTAQADTWYVNWDAAPSGDGTTWPTAFQTIEEAIAAAATTGDEIWVRAGTYNPSGIIAVDKAVAIYGGFLGGEALLSQRDWASNETIVDGGGLTRCFSVTDDATIDGFTITNGSILSSGGGVYIFGCSATIANCIVKENTVIGTDTVGGGIFCIGTTPAYITNCIFVGNSAQNGNGGAIGVGTDGSVVITNCTFSGNTAGSMGGAILAGSFGSSMTITNNILWGDSAPTDNEIYDLGEAASSITVTYSNIDQEGYAGSDGNIRQDPRFKDVTDPDPANWDLHLRLASPCIDVGNNGALGIPATDIDGSARTVAADCDGTAVADMGADEFNVTCHCVASASTLNTALGTAESNGDNDVIRVVQGFYNFAFDYTSSDGDALVLRGGYTAGCTARVIDPTKTVLDADNGGEVLDLYDSAGGDITVDGFTIQDGGGSFAPYGAGIHIRSVITPTGQSGTLTVTNNIITSNSATGQGGGVWASSRTNSGTTGDVILTNNLIYDNDVPLIGGDSDGGGVYAELDTGDGIRGTITCTNNTIADNAAQYGGGAWLELYEDEGSGGTIDCYNNIIWGNTASALGDDIYLTKGSGTAQSSHNTYADMVGDGWDSEGGYSADDPLFVGGGDYHLQPTSLCIDTGNGSAPAFCLTDIGGNTRVLDGDNDGTQTADRGAHEFVAYTVLHRDGANWNRAAGSGWDYSTPPYSPDSDFAVDMEYRADGTFLILHREGAVWDSDAGWIVDTPPYYAGDDYARDLEFMSDGSYTILHKEGALWNSTAGWTLDTPPYYPGVDYARDLEYRSDDSYVILHQEGAIYNSDSSWTLGLPPYYPGTVWAQDLELKSNETDYAVLLHEQGAMWSTDAGWALTTPPYYPGIEWAADVELKADDTGYFILHEEGAIYDSATGWNTATPPYYPGTNYAVDLEVR